MKEERRHIRVPLRLEVSWDGISSREPAITSDVSMGGCYVESLEQAAVGDVLCFEFKLPEEGSLQLYGEVLYQHPTIGFGMCFRNLDDLQRSILLRLINHARVNQKLAEPAKMPTAYPMARVAA
jgi:hypothetical protein